MSASLGIVIPGREIRHRCHICADPFYDTGDRDADDARFIRHFEACWRRRGESEATERVERNESEPLRLLGDREFDEWARNRAEERKDPTVKGTSAWNPRTAIGKRRQEG